MTVSKTKEELAKIGVETEIRKLDRDSKQEAKKLREAGDFRAGYFTFIDKVDSHSVGSLLSSIRKYSRLNPNTEITIEMLSPGGSIIDGFRLCDELESIKRQGGHHLTIKVRGQAASMAAPILQCADRRIIGPSAFLMLHRASYGAGGEAYKVEDQAEFVKMLEARIVTILADRSDRPESVFTELLSQRKDIWFTAEEAVAQGLADEVA